MKYCGGCGAALATAGAEAEVKDVAVLFADLCDYTALVASHDAEETKERVEECLRLIAGRVHTYGGKVEKFIGDAIMAVFGVPVAREDDTERAVRAGREIIDVVRDFGRRVGLKLDVRVGVHAGEVIIGAPGDAQDVFGDVVNVTSRLEDTGEAGAVVVSGAVYRRTHAFFDYETLPPVRVKGVAAPLERYRLKGEKAVRGKVRGIAGLSAPMIGRDAQLRTLLDAYTGAAAGGGARVAAIIGEAGIGKTRLVEEFLRKAGESEYPPAVWHGRCLGYAAATPYFAFAQIIKSAAGVKDDQPPAEVERRLAAVADAAFGGTMLGDVSAVGVLAEVVSGGAQQLAGRNTELIRDQIFMVSEGLFRGLAARRPTVLILEDVHWADGATLKLIAHLARTLADARCMLILNSRPPEEYGPAVSELTAALSASPNFVPIPLDDLDAAASGKLVEALLALDSIPSPSSDFIIARSGGNPLFVEEVLKALIEADVIRRDGGSWFVAREITDGDVPRSIDGVLRSRLDRLPRAGKQTIQRAAVVGRVFWPKVVSALMPAEVSPDLDDLERRDLIRRRPESIFADDAEYAFKHGLLQQTAYNSMLRRVRKELHLKAAAWIEERHAGALDAYSPLLAYHFEMGGDLAKAASYYRRAADRAAALFANDEAKSFYARAVKYAPSEAGKREALLAWGDVCILTGDNAAAASRYEEALPLASGPAAQADIVRRGGDVYERLGDYARALESYRRGESLLHGLPASVVNGQLYQSFARAHYRRGEMGEALKRAKQAETALAAAARDGADVTAVLARVCGNIGAVLFELRDFDAARDYFERALDLSQKCGDLAGVARSLNNNGAMERSAGHYDAAFDFAFRALDFAARSGYRGGEAAACANLVVAYHDLGDYENARVYAAKCLKVSAAISHRTVEAYIWQALSEMAMDEGRWEEAADSIKKAKDIFERTGAKGMAQEAYRPLVAVLAAVGRDDEARAAITAFREIAPETAVAFAEAWALLLTSRRRELSAEEKPRLAEAARQLEPATVGGRGTLIHRVDGAAFIGEVYCLLGDQARVSVAADEAGELARDIENHVGDARLRQTFRLRLASKWPHVFARP